MARGHLARAKLPRSAHTRMASRTRRAERAVMRRAPRQGPAKREAQAAAEPAGSVCLSRARPRVASGAPRWPRAP
eukprot:6175522-Pleurochrysis_carterae.AAC.3